MEISETDKNAIYKPQTIYIRNIIEQMNLLIRPLRFHINCKLISTDLVSCGSDKEGILVASFGDSTGRIQVVFEDLIDLMNNHNLEIGKDYILRNVKIEVENHKLYVKFDRKSYLFQKNLNIEVNTNDDYSSLILTN